MSVGDLKYKTFLLRALKIKKIEMTEMAKNVAKREALFLTFFGSIKCFKLFYYKKIKFVRQFLIFL